MIFYTDMMRLSVINAAAKMVVGVGLAYVLGYTYVKCAIQRRDSHRKNRKCLARKRAWWSYDTEDFRPSCFSLASSTTTARAEEAEPQAPVASAHGDRTVVRKYPRFKDRQMKQPIKEPGE
jgi:hypothetical protein